MRPSDQLRFALDALRGARTRSLLMLLAMSIGVAAVILLTALGEGARRYVIGQFEQLGTDLLVVLPGRNETTGGPPPLFGETPRDLTLDDALALRRHHSVLRVAPISLGTAPVSWRNREREVTIIGSTRDFFPVRRVHVGLGRPLPAIPPQRQLNVVVLGARLADALFDRQRPLGQWVRIGDRRFRVIGVLEAAGESLGLDLGDMALVPVASAMQLFDTQSLFRILVQARGRAAMQQARRNILATLRERHEGEEDVTLVSQDAVLGTFDRILGALTWAVGGIAGISLAVAGILIMNVMLVAVSQRVPEIGLLKALGSPARLVLRLFLIEALLLAALGALGGLLISGAGLLLMRELFPAFPLRPPLWAPLAAVAVALGCGLLFGVLPARRAARLDPVRALAGR